MKKILALVLVALAMLSCRQESGAQASREGDPTGGLTGGTTEKKKDSFFDFSQSGYLGQLPYIVSNYADEVAVFNTEHELAEKVRDSTVTWEYFDSIYSEDLPTCQKQNIAVFVLRSKDLIGLARDNPRNIVYQDAITKYLNILSTTKYFGYCLLYAALEQCHDEEFKKQIAINILNYSVGEIFHQTFLNNPDRKDDWQSRKVEEDLTYLSRIRQLAE